MEDQQEEAQDIQEEPQGIWFQEDWELTWPIWHMLPHAERKQLAHTHGFKTIGEFEEYMTLQRAVGETTTAAPYDGHWEEEHDVPSTVEQTNSPKAAADNVQDDDENSVDSQTPDDEIEAQSALEIDDELSLTELMRLGGKMLMLPEEILHRIFDWLPVDAYATLARVSPHWKFFTRTEAVYKRLCERLYLNQSKRRALHVSRFGNSYRNMLEKRPRVRAGGGLYVMKYSRVKPIQRDMWTEVPIGAILEITYYRYLYFQEDGRVLYALTTAPPHEIIRRFKKVCLLKQEDPAAVWGTYQVQSTAVTVTAQQSWQHVRLHLTIQTKNQQHGRYGYLSFDRHLSNTSGNFDEWCPSLVEYDVPEEPFRFLRDKRL